MSEDRITPGERRELRSVVRQQFRVLRTEVDQRRQELIAQAEARLVEKYRKADERADQMQWRLREITDDANRQVADMLRDYENLDDSGRWGRGPGQMFMVPSVRREDPNRNELRRAMAAGVNAQVTDAKLALDRQEADLLRNLAADALGTDAARAFLGRIPTVAELVPSRRLAEIEAQFDEGERTP